MILHVLTTLNIRLSKDMERTRMKRAELRDKEEGICIHCIRLIRRYAEDGIIRSD
jgi:hypothetical protein